MPVVSPFSLFAQAGVEAPPDGRGARASDAADQRSAQRRRPGRPLRKVVVAGLAALGMFVLLSVPVVRGEVADWDSAVSQWIHSFENRDTPLDVIDPFGLVLEPVLQALGFLLVVAVAGRLARGGEWRAALFVLGGVVGAAVLGFASKEIFARPPVDAGGSGYSFPSGHAVRSLAAAAALGMVAWPSRFRGRVLLAGVVVVGLIGVGVVYHEWHWASDVLAGWCLAIAWLACAWLVLRPPWAARHAGE